MQLYTLLWIYPKKFLMDFGSLSQIQVGWQAIVRAYNVIAEILVEKASRMVGSRTVFIHSFMDSQCGLMYCLK